jgi:hypothetical protein
VGGWLLLLLLLLLLLPIFGHGNASLPRPPHLEMPLRNPDTSELGNCLIKPFNDAPLWTIPTDFDWRNKTINLRPYCVYKCDSYLRLFTKTCAQRSRWA